MIDVDYYKGDHHGSHTSSSAAFMNDLRPTVIVLSNGSDGLYKHPRQVSLQRYGSLVPPTTVFQVNKCFHPAPCTNVPDAQIADPETVDQDGTILTTVDGVANAYTVVYGTTTRSFTIKAPTTSTPVAASVVISSVLPNPAGSDEQNESVTIQNKGHCAKPHPIRLPDHQDPVAVGAAGHLPYAGRACRLRGRGGKPREGKPGCT